MRPERIIGTTVKTIQKYQNWAEIITSRAKKQIPAEFILRDGARFETGRLLVWHELVNEIFFDHVYTPVPLQIGRNDIVVDIGAHIGVFSVFAASITQNTVYAFEPSPPNFEVLKRNISVNGVNNIVASRSAVSDKLGSTTLLPSSASSTNHLLFNHTILHQLERYQASVEHRKYKRVMPRDFEEYIVVPTTTLQDIMDSNNIEQVDFLKMDCEGSEGLILVSTPKSYLQRVRKIAFEFHDHLSHISHDDMRKLLEELGFTTDLKWDGKSPVGFLYGWRESFSKANSVR